MKSKTNRVFKDCEKELFTALRERNTVALARICDRKSLNKSDETGKTLLISATVRGRHSTLDYLLQQPGIDINARESSGDWGGTAFHFACYYHKKTIAEKLISAGCNTILQDKNGDTGLDVCDQSLRVELKTYIRKLRRARSAAKCGMIVQPRVRGGRRTAIIEADSRRLREEIEEEGKDEIRSEVAVDMGKDEGRVARSIEKSTEDSLRKSVRILCQQLEVAAILSVKALQDIRPISSVTASIKRYVSRSHKLVACSIEEGVDANETGALAQEVVKPIVCFGLDETGVNLVVMNPYDSPAQQIADPSGAAEGEEAEYISARKEGASASEWSPRLAVTEHFTSATSAAAAAAIACTASPAATSTATVAAPAAASAIASTATTPTAIASTTPTDVISTPSHRWQLAARYAANMQKWSPSLHFSPDKPLHPSAEVSSPNQRIRASAEDVVAATGGIISYLQDTLSRSRLASLARRGNNKPAAIVTRRGCDEHETNIDWMLPN